MSTTLTVKRGDTYQTIEDILKVGGEPLALSGATVKLLFEDQRDPAVRLEKTAEIYDSEEGIVRFRLDDDVTSELRSWRMEWEVTIGGRAVTFPDSTYHTLNVIQDLNDDAS